MTLQVEMPVNLTFSVLDLRSYTKVCMTRGKSQIKVMPNCIQWVQPPLHQHAVFSWFNHALCGFWCTRRQGSSGEKTNKEAKGNEMLIARVEATVVRDNLIINSSKREMKVVFQSHTLSHNQKVSFT